MRSLSSQRPLSNRSPDDTTQVSFGHSTPRSAIFTDTEAKLTRDSLLHLELFYNFEHQICRTFTHTEAHIGIYRRVILGRSFQVPYLMEAALGLSALHLSREASERQVSYRNAAAVLQSQALQGFESSQILQDVNTSNVLDLLLFQHLIALHVFCDIFTTTGSDFGDFMEKLIGCIQLLRGLNLVTEPWFDVLAKTELGVIMLTAHVHQKSPHASHHECDPLLIMLDEADLSAQSIEVCRLSIERLQTYFDADNEFNSEQINSTNMLFSWLITSSQELTGLLKQRRPEALVILAYYAVLLYRRRRNWVVASAGQKLLQHVRTYLGSTWEAHLLWPITEIVGHEK